MIRHKKIHKKIHKSADSKIYMFMFICLFLLAGICFGYYKYSNSSIDSLLEEGQKISQDSDYVRQQMKKGYTYEEARKNLLVEKQLKNEN